MNQKLQPLGPMSQVVFVHDYLQLVFQDDIFTLYNSPEIRSAGAQMSRGSPGFCDALVALLGQRLTLVSANHAEPLILSFENGTRVIVPVSGRAASGPEAWRFGRTNGPVVVQENV
jgi:hypothetical protein